MRTPDDERDRAFRALASVREALLAAKTGALFMGLPDGMSGRLNEAIDAALSGVDGCAAIARTGGDLVREKRPTVVCLCGSTRFYDAFQRANYDETMAGRIVLTVGFYPHASQQAHGEEIGCSPEQKHALDRLHLRKIDLADEILVLDVGDYVGASTQREIEYARMTGKRVRWLGQEEMDDG